jgi:hypothetical protein
MRVVPVVVPHIIRLAPIYKSESALAIHKLARQVVVQTRGERLGVQRFQEIARENGKNGQKAPGQRGQHVSFLRLRRGSVAFTIMLSVRARCGFAN